MTSTSTLVLAHRHRTGEPRCLRPKRSNSVWMSMNATNVCTKVVCASTSDPTKSSAVQRKPPWHSTSWRRNVWTNPHVHQVFKYSDGSPRLKTETTTPRVHSVETTLQEVTRLNKFSTAVCQLEQKSTATHPCPQGIDTLSQSTPQIGRRKNCIKQTRDYSGHTVFRPRGIADGNW